MKKKEKEENAHFISIKKSILVLSEVPYLLNYRCCQSVKSLYILYLLVSLRKLERVPLYCLFTLSLSIKKNCSSQWYPGFIYLRTTTSHVTSPQPNIFVALLRPHCNNTTHHHPPFHPATRIILMWKKWGKDWNLLITNCPTHDCLCL